MTDSNFTLGALSPESSELISELDPVLGSITAPAHLSIQHPSVPTFGPLLSEASNASPRDLSDTDFDLGFYFGTNDSRSEAEDEDVVKTRPQSSAGSVNSIDVLSEQLEASLEDMIQTAQMHPRSLQVSSFFNCNHSGGFLVDINPKFRLESW